MYPQPLHLNENEETARRPMEKFELFTTFFHELWIWILKYFLTGCLHENKQAFSNNHHPFWDSLWDNKNAWSWFCNLRSITKCYLNKNVYFTGSEILFSYLLFSWRVQCSRKGNSKTFWIIESVTKLFCFDIDNSLEFCFLGIKLFFSR